MEEKKKHIIFWGLTIILAGVLLFGFSGSAMGDGGIEKQARERYYREMEHRLSEELRKRLEAEGIYHSGITMTHRIEGEQRAYTLLVHHDRIARMDDNERKEFAERLEAQNMPQDFGEITIRFLEP